MTPRVNYPTVGMPLWQAMRHYFKPQTNDEILKLQCELAAMTDEQIEWFRLELIKIGYNVWPWNNSPSREIKEKIKAHDDGVNYEETKVQQGYSVGQEHPAVMAK